MEENAVEEFENIPFEEQEKYGLLNSFLMTVFMLIRTPGAFFSKMHINKGLKLPLIFMFIMISFSVIMNYIYISTEIMESPVEQVIELMENDPQMQEKAEEMKKSVDTEHSVTDIFYNILVNFTFFLLMAYFWNMIFRSVSVALNGKEATIRVFAYSSVVLISSIIPSTGPIFSMLVYIWWVYVMYKGISEAHEVSGRVALRGILLALMATLIPVMIIFLTLF